MRLVSFASPLVWLVLSDLGGCDRGCGAKHQTSRALDGAGLDVAAPTADGVLPSTSGQASFSAPIGAARVAGIDVVAGLVVAESTVRALGLTQGGVLWSADVLRGVAWAPDAELQVHAVGDGAVILWRGLRDGKPVRTVLTLSRNGEPRAQSVDIGAAFCSTVDGMAWTAARTSGPIRVRARRWTENDARDVVIVPRDRDPSLVCADHDVMVLGDGDDDLTVSRVAPGDAVAQPPAILLRDVDFPDDEREHDTYSIGDSLGIVRVGVSGAIAMRDMPHSGVPEPWRRLRHIVSADDDIVAVDGDEATTLIVTTHEVEGACLDGGSSAASVRAIRVDRRTREESVLELAPAACERTAGPFWIATGPGGLVVAWVERRTAPAPKAAPIAGVAFRVVGSDSVSAGRIEQLADAFVSGGCDERGCSMAALVREPDSDGMRPAPIRVFGYP
jgi:hypothetical protein